VCGGMGVVMGPEWRRWRPGRFQTCPYGLPVWAVHFAYKRVGSLNLNPSANVKPDSTVSRTQRAHIAHSNQSGLKP